MRPVATPDDDASTETEDSRPTRSEQTRAATAVNRLGLRLSTLSPAALDRLELPERIREEIDVCQRLPPRSRGRQIRLIGQLLRADDHETIRARVESLDRHHRHGVQHEKMNERWLDRLLTEGDPGVEALILELPEADRQQLRTLTRTARQEPGSKRSARARRELLRAIRALRASVADRLGQPP